MTALAVLAKVRGKALIYTKLGARNYYFTPALVEEVDEFHTCMLAGIPQVGYIRLGMPPPPVLGKRIADKVIPP